jgi:type II secretory pathway component PulF
MALYHYQAFKRDGSRAQGTIDATSVQEVRNKLSRLGLFPVEIIRAREEQGISIFQTIVSFFQPKITVKDVIFFTKQLAVLLKAGVPLLQAMELLIEQTEKKLQRIVIDLKDTIKEGRSLADGLEAYPKVFDITYVQLVRAGEASGRLETILDRLVNYLEHNQEIRKKINGALRLPLIQLVIVFIVVGILLVVVFPEVTKAFSSQGFELPLITRMLMNLSNAILSHYLLIATVLASIVGFIVWWKSTQKGARLWDAMMLKLPLVGYFVRMGAVVQFSSTLGMLVESGVNLPEALEIVCKIIDNRILVDALREAREKIIKQGNITTYLRGTGLFPPVALYLIRTGEESGQLGQMLLTVAQTFDSEVRERADALSESLGPIMIVVMGIIVGVIVLAVAKPIMQLSDIAGSSLSKAGIRS